MMNEIIFIIEESPEGGYTARSLGEDIFTEADDFQSLKKNVQDALRCHFEADDLPKLVRLHYVKDEVASHHKLSKQEVISFLF